MKNHSNIQFAIGLGVVVISVVTIFIDVIPVIWIGGFVLGFGLMTDAGNDE